MTQFDVLYPPQKDFIGAAQRLARLQKFAT